MKNIAKILIISLFLTFVLNLSWTYAVKAEISDEAKINILKKIDTDTVKFSLQKDFLIKSLKNDKTEKYDIVIHSSIWLEKIESKLWFFDNSIEITYVSWDTYVLDIPYDSKIAKYLLKNLDKGELPKNILGLSVEKPFEVNINWYLDGENLGELWWIKKMWADLYQLWLSNQAKIKVWIIDTWIDYTHPDLSNNYNSLLWYDFVNNDNDPIDDHGHGTHVSWTVWWVVNQNWVFWVNANVDLVWLKVLSSWWSGSSWDIWDAIRYAADNSIKVLNLSLWGRGTPSGSYICSSIDYALNLWTITVVAAWNSDWDTSRYVPAWCPNAITVAAVDSNLDRAYFSNFGDEVDVSAPWMWIYSSILSGWYDSWNGTSMASPHIAWLVSAMLTYDSGLTLSEIEWIFDNINLTDSVKSHKRKYIWKFANMAKIMDYLWVTDDNWNIPSDPSDNTEPTVTLSEEITNTKQGSKHKITANAIDDWTIVNYEFQIFVNNVLNNTVSGTSNILQVNFWKRSPNEAEIVVIVTDDWGLTWASDILTIIK